MNKYTRFDKSRIPPDKLQDPRLAKLEADLLEMMQDDGYRLRTCLHEAAHAVYLERAGALEVILHGPVALYCPEKDSFHMGTAAVQGRFSEDGQMVDSVAMARWYAAGGVAKRLLTNDPDPGADQDFEVFCAEFRRLTPQHEHKEESLLEHWEQAAKDVEKDLRDPAFRRLLWRRAHELKRLLEAEDDG